MLLFSCSSISLASLDPGGAPQAPPTRPTLAATEPVTLLDSAFSDTDASVVSSFVSLFFSLLPFPLSLSSAFISLTGKVGPTATLLISTSSSSSSSSSAFLVATATRGACRLGVLGTTGTMVGSGFLLCREASVSSCRTIFCCSEYSTQSSSDIP